MRVWSSAWCGRSSGGGGRRRLKLSSAANQLLLAVADSRRAAMQDAGDAAFVELASVLLRSLAWRVRAPRLLYALLHADLCALQAQRFETQRVEAAGRLPEP